VFFFNVLFYFVSYVIFLLYVFSFFVRLTMYLVFWCFVLFLQDLPFLNANCFEINGVQFAPTFLKHSCEHATFFALAYNYINISFTLCIILKVNH